jgi:hypothetical protein
MELENIASALYGTEENGTSLEVGSGSLLGTGHEAPTKINERPGQKPPVEPESLFRADGEGDSPSTYDPHIETLFSGQEKDARINHDHPRLEALAAGRKSMEAVLKQFDVGDSTAKNLMITARDYVDNPRTSEQIEAANIVTRKALEEKWGSEYGKMIAGAKRVLSEAARKVPGLIDTFNNTGLGSDEMTIITLANAARRKGYIK